MVGASETQRMGALVIRWQYFPKNQKCTPHLLSVIRAFETVDASIASEEWSGQTSNEVLEKARPQLEKIGYTVESSKKSEGKISVPVLYGPQGRVEKYFDADAFNESEGCVIEVEAGRAVTNYQFLKDLFQACVMQDVNYLAIAVRNDYRGKSDFEAVRNFLETLYSSDRLKLPLQGILILGY